MEASIIPKTKRKNVEIIIKNIKNKLLKKERSKQ